MLVRSALGRSIVPLRHRSAYEVTPLRLPARYLTSRSAGHIPARQVATGQELHHTTCPHRTKHFLSQAQRPGIARFFATMHRSPAAMVTKPMTDPNIEIRTPRDPNTLSNYHNFVTRHTSVDFDIDFQRKRLFGSVVLRLECLTDEDVKEVVLDSR